MWRRWRRTKGILRFSVPRLMRSASTTAQCLAHMLPKRPTHDLQRNSATVDERSILHKGADHGIPPPTPF
jgi:hypothetical protein